jgi:hypothetical protein
MPITASAGQIAATPVWNGPHALALVSGSQPANVTGSVPTGPGITLTSDLTTVSLINAGTLDPAASLALQAQINGSSFLPVLINGTAKTWTGAQINAGVIETLQLKVNQIRFVLTPGTTTGTNGVVTRVLD